MKKGFRNFCNGATSTSTLNQRKTEHMHRDDEEHSCMFAPSMFSSYMEMEAETMLHDHPSATPPTLEEMLARLDKEEEAARQANAQRWRRVGHRLIDDDDAGIRRMSCVNNSDILRSARKALDQYPRFSLDGRDALYRSSFTNYLPQKLVKERIGLELQGSCCCGLPTTIGGQRVAWCKPGVVAKLMGLEFIPVPLGPNINRFKESTRKDAFRTNELERLECDYKGKMCSGRQGSRTTMGCSYMNKSLPSDAANKLHRKDWRMRHHH